MTFRDSRETLEYTLSLLNRLDEPRPGGSGTRVSPILIRGISGHALSQIDYLVAHPWELSRRYVPAGGRSFDILMSSLGGGFTYGVETLCIPDRFGMYRLLRTARHV